MNKGTVEQLAQLRATKEEETRNGRPSQPCQ